MVLDFPLTPYPRLLVWAPWSRASGGGRHTNVLLFSEYLIHTHRCSYHLHLYFSRPAQQTSTHLPPHRLSSASCPIHLRVHCRKQLLRPVVHLHSQCRSSPWPRSMG